MRRAMGLALLALLIAGSATLALAAWRWSADTDRAVAALEHPPRPGAPARVDTRMFEGLPPPVARYFRAALTDGQPIPTRWRVTQQGTFRTGESGDSWRPFRARQEFRAMPPGMVWDAAIGIGPGLEVAVRDSYLEGHGAMRGAALRLFRVVDARPDPALDAAALQRYLAEAVWCPTALLPANGVTWVALDDSTARATLTDRGIAVSLVFRFGADSMIVSSRAETRGRAVGDRYVPTPWGGRYADVGEALGMRVPRTAEVAWELPLGRFPYWIGRLTRVEDRTPGR